MTQRPPNTIAHNGVRWIEIEPPQWWDEGEDQQSWGADYPGSWDEADPLEDDPAYMSAAKYYEMAEDNSEQLRSLDYRAEYLQTPHWQLTRKRALLRAGFQCQGCERANLSLDVHHLTYDRLGREAEADLIVLCRLCHAKEHGTDGDFLFVAQKLSERDAMSILKSGGMDGIKRVADALRKGPVIP